MTAARDREILRLAVPAFLALVAEPLFLLADAAIVGHLGTAELAGLGIAAVVLQTVVGLCVFLAYGTTAQRRPPARRRRPARRPGPGRRRALAGGRHRRGRHGRRGRGHRPAGRRLRRRAGGRPSRRTTYLRIAFLGTVPLLLMLAATGVLRGLQDTRTPLVVAVGGNALNVVLNLVLVYPAGLGIAGSALGSVLAQVASAAAFVVVVVRAARRHGAPLRPDLPGIRPGRPRRRRRSSSAPSPCGPRCWSRRTPSPSAPSPATQEVDLATHQLAMTLWTFLAFVLDAIAIAAQALTGRLLGAGDVAGARAMTQRMVRWGAGQRRGHRAAARRGQPVDRAPLHRRRRGQRPAGPGAAGRRARPAGRRRRVRARRGADRRRRRPLPGPGRPGHAGRSTRRWRCCSRRTPPAWSRSGWRSARSSWAPGWWSWYAGPAATRGW